MSHSSCMALEYGSPPLDGSGAIVCRQTTPVYGLQYICGEPPVQHALDEEEPQLREPQFSEALAKCVVPARHPRRNVWD